MCAINGVTWRDEVLVNKMNASNTSRGPDACGIYTGPNYTIGHNLLIINSEDLEEARQPFKENDCAMSFNGEIYDADENELDSKWLFRKLIEYGPEFMKKRNGQWAIAFVRGDTLYLLRDHFGAKPLYIAECEKGLIFSSTTDAILETNLISSNLNTKMLELMEKHIYWQYGRRTPYENIEKLAPGEVIEYSLSTKKIVKRWNLWEGYSLQPTIEYNHFEYRTKVLEAIWNTARTKQKSALMLSGGLDSTLIAGVLGLSNNDNFHCATLAYNFGNIKTTEVSLDMLKEVEYAKATCEEYKLPLQVCTFPGDQEAVTRYAEKCLKVAGSMHEDSYRMIPRLFLLEHLKKAGVKVVLNGDGGDELFTGYNRHRDWLDTEKRPRIKDAIAYQEKLELSEWFPMSVFHGTDPITGILFMDILTTCEMYLMRADVFCGSLGMESRSPLLYQDLVKYVMQLPPSVKLQSKSDEFRGINKFLVREAFADVLPDHVKNRKNKLGWSLPYWRDPQTTKRRRVMDRKLLQGLADEDTNRT